MDIDIIIPNFNGAVLFEKNLPAVLKSHTKYDGKIIIVDDGSQDTDKKKLKRIIEKNDSKKIKLIEHPVNMGFSSAINTGVRCSSAKYVVLLNSDVVPSDIFLQSLISKIEKSPDIFGIGCMDESIEGNKIIKRGRGIGYWKNGMILHKRGEVNSEDTFWISGGSCILRREVFLKLGGMDIIYNPFYWEDIDLSYRARKAGYRIIFDNNSVVRHFHDEGSIKKGFSDNSVNKIAYRNQFIFIWKNITSRHLLVSHIFNLPVNFFGAVKRVDIPFFEGFFLAVLNLPAIIRKRNLQKSYYKVSDLSLLDKIS